MCQGSTIGRRAWMKRLVGFVFNDCMRLNVICLFFLITHLNLCLGVGLKKKERKNLHKEACANKRLDYVFIFYEIFTSLLNTPWSLCIQLKNQYTCLFGKGNHSFFLVMFYLRFANAMQIAWCTFDEHKIGNKKNELNDTCIPYHGEDFDQSFEYWL